MNLQRVIDRVYNVNLPIHGGSGESFEDAIIVESGALPGFVDMEYKVVDYLTVLQGYHYKFVEQALVKKGPKFFDKITVNLTCIGTSTHFYKDFFFDITACFNNRSMSLLKREW